MSFDESSKHIFTIPPQQTLLLPGVDLSKMRSAAERIQLLAVQQSGKHVICNLCGKLIGRNHVRNKYHLQKVVEQAYLDVALGEMIPFRLRSLTPLESKGLPCGPNAQGLTHERFLAHWGNNVESLCQFALHRFKAVGSINLLKHTVP